MSSSDISKCSGVGCPIRSDCHRFVQESNPQRQSYIHPPYSINNGVFSCSMFWGQPQTSILDSLKEILKPKNK